MELFGVDFNLLDDDWYQMFSDASLVTDVVINEYFHDELKHLISSRIHIPINTMGIADIVGKIENRTWCQFMFDSMEVGGIQKSKVRKVLNKAWQRNKDLFHLIGNVRYHNRIKDYMAWILGKLVVMTLEYMRGKSII